MTKPRLIQSIGRAPRGVWLTSILSLASCGSAGGGGQDAGATASGGANAATGGATGGGGAAATGSGGAGGATVCDAAFSVEAGNYVTSDCWHGHAYAIANGTAGSELRAVCPDPLYCVLCANAGVEPNDANVAGMGLNLNQAIGGNPVGWVPTGESVTLTFGNTGGGGGPFFVDLVGADGLGRWCYEWAAPTTNPITIAWNRFNTECWAGGAGTYYAKQPIKALEILLRGTSGGSSQAFNMCLSDTREN